MMNQSKTIKNNLGRLRSPNFLPKRKGNMKKSLLIRKTKQKNIALERQIQLISKTMKTKQSYQRESELVEISLCSHCLINFGLVNWWRPEAIVLDFKELRISLIVLSGWMINWAPIKFYELLWEKECALTDRDIIIYWQNNSDPCVR